MKGDGDRERETWKKERVALLSAEISRGKGVTQRGIGTKRFAQWPA